MALNQGYCSDSTLDISAAPRSRSANSYQRVAIRVKDACKNFGSLNVMNNLNMTVREGEIYVLLGSSGSGKTTLLSSIVRLIKLKSGSISIFGNDVNSKESGVPGPIIGFMPQDIALYGEFTIKETLEYFGKIYGMTHENIKLRINFLLKLLDLERKNEQIQNLSGGQKRRASFAATLLHEPPLLILDEPTIGVDPLLRECIWNHLVEIKSTIIITTHYIDNAYQANTIGLMRNGRLIMEDSPGHLQEIFHTGLEDIILTLCNANENQTSETVFPIRNDSLEEYPKNSTLQSYINKVGFFTKFSSLTKRNFLFLWRRIIFTIFMIIFPAGSVTFIHYTVGGAITGLKMGYVDNENPNFDPCLEDLNCNYTQMGCRIVKHLEDLDIAMIRYSNEEEALSDAMDTKIYGFIVIPDTFSNSVKTYIANRDSRLENFIIGKFDKTNMQIWYVIQRKVVAATSMFANFLIEECNIEPQRFDIVEYGSQIFGVQEFADVSFRKYVTPSMMLQVILLIGLALTSYVIIQEKKSGTYERTISLGVRKIEVFMSHLVTQSFLLFFTIIATLFVVIVFLGIEVLGSFPLYFLMVLIEGCLGLSFGIFLSSIISSEFNLIQIILVFLMLDLYLSATLWPNEGMPDVLKIFSYIFSQNLGQEAIRSIGSRGLPFTNLMVWPGFLHGIVWLIIFQVAAVYLQ